MGFLSKAIRSACDEQHESLKALLRELGRLPAPSHCEDRRAAFIRDWFVSIGAKDVRIDSAKNVLVPIGDCVNGPVSIVMAHTDIVFSDMDLLPMREKNGRLYAPGIGDDTANLVNLMFAAKYLLEHGIVPRKGGLLIAANSCEEGLGNLKGSKEIIREYGAVARRVISLDVYTGTIASRAVGSHRYKITVRTTGGHSYGDFGNANAIAQLSEIICGLYRKEVPNSAKTTYNVGVIEGGTTVNSICGECSALYEYRSESRECLEEMRMFFDSTIEAFRAQGMNIDVDRIGDRPCTGDVDDRAERELEAAAAKIIAECTGNEPITGAAMSTDCNTSLAAGIPSICTGTVEGAGMHTREEWIDLESLKTGLPIALGLLLYCCEN